MSGGVNMHKKYREVRTLAMPENRPVLAALEDVVSHFRQDKPSMLPHPIYLHGSAGVGKTRLTTWLVREIAAQQGGHVLTVLDAGELWGPVEESPGALSFRPPQEALDRARAADLLVLEDLQHLRMQAVDALVQILDHRAARCLPSVLTGPVGPRFLGRGNELFPARLSNRLAGGLVIALEPWGPASRLLFLEELAQSRQFVPTNGVLPWLAEHLPGSGRVLEGAFGQVEILAQQRHKQGRQLDQATLAEHFRSQHDACRATVERIAEQVSGYFRLEPSLLQSRRRYRKILLPRQVSMYLARKLTAMSLEQIGAFFGGRDHTTVLHACRKMEQVLETDPVLSGVVRQLHAQLA